MKPVSSVQEAMQLVDSFTGPPSEFQLLIPDALNDVVGINMAIITDRVLARGWQPNGFVQANGYRIYQYEPLE
jgi:hypothetical protein